MNINHKSYTSLWHDPETDQVLYIDQTRLPWELVIREMKTFEDGIRAIKDMEVRGAPLIGVAAAFALYVGTRGAQGHKGTGAQGHRGTGAQGHGDTGAQGEWESMVERLLATRPTAVNLRNAILYMTHNQSPFTIHQSLLSSALALRESELLRCRRIGEHGLMLIEEVAMRKQGEVVNILTHCNAGWLATVDYGTALAPVYLAHDKGIKVHVWVDETRPRNQGSRLTAFELSQHGVPCTVIVDNAGGHLMQRGEVDLCLVGADRITRNGDAANKIGTYLKALAAFDNQIPFYVAAPTSTFDPEMQTGDEIPIEERDGGEVRDGEVGAHGVRPSTPMHETTGIPDDIPVRNPGFDVTPRRLITGYITEDGVGL